MGTTTSAVASSAFRVEPDARVEWQIVKKNSAPSATGWQTATGLTSWTFQFATSSYGAGNWTIVVRRVENDLEVARSTVGARFR
jgi:predicted NACHT family NTPase